MLANFTAEASLYKSARMYRRGTRGSATGGQAVVRTAQEEVLEFTCSSGACACQGLPDCSDMFDTNVCGPVAFCDSTGGDLSCACLRP
ncbi:hypothetical protein EV645_7792 [Kribbella rubisoli]|jgi:hypothetical protein|uniref:Uncharacterized protein n=1 Tax=Kribbella rubisoli TaxID=3075929 RepID=A0A4V2FUE2_9ACTN|nr:hypothetical protein EV645_7792 [Kribbella rubisoli]